MTRTSESLETGSDLSLPGWRGHEPLVGRVDEAMHRLHGKAPDLSSALADFPLAQAAEIIGAYDPGRPYSQIKPGLERLAATLEQRFGARLSMHYGLALLASKIGAHSERWPCQSLDATLEVEFIDSFHRILTAASRGGVMALKPGTDAFAKEYAICLYHMIPLGGQMVDPASGVPRSTLLRRPSAEKLRAAAYVLVNARGRKPFAELHTNIFQRHWFTPTGWEYSFRRMPAVFRSYPALKGLIGSTWFLDPALADLSPELDFVRSVARRWGAVFVHVGADREGVSGALSLSRERRERFERGDYVPEIYSLLVSKRDILRRDNLRSTS